MRRIRTLHAKWVGAVGSHRASMLAASVLLSLLVTASGFFGVDMDQQTQAGVAGFLATLYLAIWSDTRRPLAPRDGAGNPL